MTIFNNVVISEIVAACFVPIGTGAPVHTNRKSHGFAYSCDCTSTYRFSSGETFECADGECVYLPKSSNYTVDKVPTSSDPAKGVYAINFHILENDDVLKKPFKIKKKDILLASFKKAEKAWIKKKVSYNEICFSELYKIISLINEDKENKTSECQAKELLKPALEYVENNFEKETFSTAELAALCNVSEVYMRRLFNRAFSTSPSVYIRNQRLSFSRELLKTGEYSVAAVASLSGFNDIAYFSREFKKATGVSPSEYKNKSQ